MKKFTYKIFKDKKYTTLFKILNFKKLENLAKI